MLKTAFLIAFVGLAANTLGARIARSPGGAGWQGSIGGGYGDSGPSIVAARSGGGGWNSGNVGRSFRGTSSGWGGSGLSARSGGPSGWAGSGGNYEGFAGRSSGGFNGFAGRSAGDYSGYSGNSAGYGGYSTGDGGWDSSDFSDASGRSVSWQASW